MSFSDNYCVNMDVREQWDLTSSGFCSEKFSANVVDGTITGLLSSFWMQLVVNEVVLAQHKLATLTSGSSSFVSILFFFPPQGMYRRHQEKHPSRIVRNQCREQGVGPKCCGELTVQGTSLHHALTDVKS